MALEKKIRVADAFSGASRGSLFGKFVPALLVYRKTNEDLIDVAPKESSFLKPLIVGDSIEILLRLTIEMNAMIKEEKLLHTMPRLNQSLRKQSGKFCGIRKVEEMVSRRMSARFLETQKNGSSIFSAAVLLQSSVLVFLILQPCLQVQ